MFCTARCALLPGESMLLSFRSERGQQPRRIAFVLIGVKRVDIGRWVCLGLGCNGAVVGDVREQGDQIISCGVQFCSIRRLVCLSPLLSFVSAIREFAHSVARALVSPN